MATGTDKLEKMNKKYEDNHVRLAKPRHPTF